MADAGPAGLSAREARAFVAGCVRADLDIDRRLVLACVKAVEIVGEAAYKMSADLGATATRGSGSTDSSPYFTT